MLLPKQVPLESTPTATDTDGEELRRRFYNAPFRSEGIPLERHPPVEVLDGLRQLCVADLAGSASHPLSYFQGTVLAMPAPGTDTLALVEDARGSAVAVGLVDLTVGPHVGEGAVLTVIEPCCTDYDGGVRIVSAGELWIGCLSCGAMGTPMTEYDVTEPLRLFDCKFLTRSAAAFRTTLITHQDVCNVLSNAALCLFKLKNHRLSLTLAMAAIVINQRHYKAWYRALIALREIRRHEECRALFNVAPVDFQSQLKGHLCPGKGGRGRPLHDLCSLALSLACKDVRAARFPVAPATGASVSSLKESGNEAFRLGDYRQAFSRYMQALDAADTVLLALQRLAQCHSCLVDARKGVEYAVASLVIDMSQTDLWMVLAEGLHELRLPDRALWAARMGLSVRGSNCADPEILMLLKRLEVVKSFTDVLPAAPNGRMLHGRQRTTVLANNKLHPDPVEPRDVLFQLFGTTSGFLDKRIPAYYREVDFDAIPEIDTSLTSKWAKSDHTNTMTLPSLLLGNEGFFMDERQLTERLNSVDPSVHLWYGQAAVGDICPRRSLDTFSDNSSRSFSNALPPRVEYEFGQNHLGLDGSDLVPLLFGLFVGLPAVDGPARYFGYYQSAYAVAKALILQRLMSSSVHPRQVLQVWFSSGWSIHTLRAFRWAAARSFYEIETPTGPVGRLLQFWSCCPGVSLREAQATWLEDHSADTFVGSLRCRADREATLTYDVTGRLFECDVGSVCMFCLPAGYPPITHDESVWSLYEEVSLPRTQYATFFDALLSDLTGRIENLTQLIRSGNLEICVSLRSNDDDVRLKELQPRTIVWANTCEYAHPDEFRRLVMEVTSTEHPTTHYCHSASWHTLVKGAHVVDYQRRAHSDLLKKSQEECTRQFPAEMRKYLVLPLPLHPFSVCLSYLCQSFADKWVEQYFGHWKPKTRLVTSLFSRGAGLLQIEFTVTNPQY
ncbi:MAG: hypothetical protein KVP17_000842 [Porospora cf. gigantea B]|uniref:uncharacterized protein n=1 Tax=Porospora cf. gigantea B TaxID=2853592 RepID=UPI003571B6FC|nr:MAG: hypothetical protein KVP17_000842 [Porospora cf. gigantea B]